MRKTLALLVLAVSCALGLWLLTRFDSPAPDASASASTAGGTSGAEARKLLARKPNGDIAEEERDEAGTPAGTRALVSTEAARAAVPVGALAGTLIDGDERPMPGMRLWTFPAELIEEPKDSLMRWKAEIEAREEEAIAAEEASEEAKRAATSSDVRNSLVGRDDALMPDSARTRAPKEIVPVRYAVVSTGRSGEFRFDRLAPGQYFIAAENDLDLGRTTLSRQAFETGNLLIRLVLTPRWLRVRAEGMDEDERATGIIYCRQALSEGARIDEPTWEAESTPDRALFPVEVGRTYVYGWVSDSHPPCEARVTIPSDDLTTTRVLSLGPPTERGMLILHVSKPDGSPWVAGARLRARARSSGREFARTGGELPMHLYLPPGEFMLSVDIGNVDRLRNGEPVRPDDYYGVTELACDIRPGGTTEVDARLLRSGILDLALYAERELSDGEAWSLAAMSGVSARARKDGSHADAAHPDATNDSEYVDPWPVMLDGGPSRRRPLQMDMHYDTRRRQRPGSMRVEQDSGGQFRPAGDRTLRIRTPVEPGEYDLRVHLPGFAPLERKLQIRAGQDEELSVEMTRVPWKH